MMGVVDCRTDLDRSWYIEMYLSLVLSLIGDG